MKLTEYEKKRDFAATPEPTGEEKSSAEGLRFVVQKHHASRLHYDLRLELDGVLKSWAVPKGPTLDPQEKRLAVMVEDHPYDYQDFEGVIPAGNYGAGTMVIWDQGTYHAYDSTDRDQSIAAAKKGLEKGDFKFTLEGGKLRGKFALVRMKEEENNWLLIKKKDEFAVADFTMESLADPFPQKIKPMLATLAEGPFNHPDWLYEIKFDGYRVIADVKDGNVELFSRNLKSFNQLFAPVAAAFKGSADAVYDGEVVILDERGRSRFQLLQNYAKGTIGTKGELVYFVFDLLYLEGRDLRKLPLFERKDMLKQFLPDHPLIRYVDDITGAGKEFFALAKENGLEGIIAKRRTGAYQEGRRSNEWLKIKVTQRQEAVICGFTRPKGSRTSFGSLILGVYENGRLIHIGSCGTGFTDQTLRNISALLKPLIRETSPFDGKVTAADVIIWVEPQLVCEVEFAEWTDEGLLRHPSFLGLRKDKPAEKVTRGLLPAPDTGDELMLADSQPAPPKSKKDREVSINGQTLRLTNLDKIFWPTEGYTKGDVIDYYRKVAPFLLPHLKDRPQSLYRTPNGITAGGFYQKDVSSFAADWTETYQAASSDDDKNKLYLLCQNEQTLVYMANLGCIEINPWLSRIQSPDHPDYLVIDLDPEDISFEKVIETAQAVHEVLQSAKITSFPKTSGSTGLHICIPLQAQYHYDIVREFAHLIATLVHRDVPAFTSIERSPKKRQQKVYLDYLQNRSGQTLASVYSIRPKPGATVSAPLQWKEVKAGLDPGEFTIKSIHKRLAKVGDFFAGIMGPGTDIAESIRQFEKRFVLT